MHCPVKCKKKTRFKTGFSVRLGFLILKIDVMKKLMVIAAAFFFFTGCYKKENAPDPFVNQVDYYMIINNETDFGVVEYRVKYTDCGGVNQDVPLLMGEKIVVCVQDGMINTNFAHTIEKMVNYHPDGNR